MSEANLSCFKINFFVCVCVVGSVAQILQKAEVKVINDTICNMVTENQVTSRMMCSGYLSGGIDACQVKNNNYKSVCITSQIVFFHVYSY